MTGNAYIDLLNKTNTKTETIKLAHSPKRQIVIDQKNKCFLCEKQFNNSMCYFSIISAPSSKTGFTTKELRAICQDCFFKVEKKK